VCEPIVPALYASILFESRSICICALSDCMPTPFRCERFCFSRLSQGASIGQKPTHEHQRVFIRPPKPGQASVALLTEVKCKGPVLLTSNVPWRACLKWSSLSLWAIWWCERDVVVVVWPFLDRGTKVLEQKPLKLVNYGVPNGWRELPGHPLEIRDYMVWTRDTYTPVVDSGKNPNPWGNGPGSNDSAQCLSSTTLGLLKPWLVYRLYLMESAWHPATQ